MALLSGEAGVGGMIGHQSYLTPPKGLFPVPHNPSACITFKRPVDSKGDMTGDSLASHMALSVIG